MVVGRCLDVDIRWVDRKVRGVFGLLVLISFPLLVSLGIDHKPFAASKAIRQSRRYLTAQSCEQNLLEGTLGHRDQWDFSGRQY